MLACGRCQAANPEAARFCQACGASLATEASPNRERKLVSVVFVDVVGSTGFGDQADPEDLKDALGRVFAPVREQADLYGGTVEKFIGDAAVVVFGAPIAHGDDSERAVRCALGIVNAVAADPQQSLAVRAGVSTGEAVVTLGLAYERGEPLATGDVMNTAARLQAAAPPGRVAVGPMTYAATRRRIAYEALPPLSLRGKSGSISAWLAMGEQAGGESVIPTTPMIGRDRELGRLLEALREAQVTQVPRFVTVVGEPGIGKSRLADEFGLLAEKEGVVRVVAHCLPFEPGGGYPATARHISRLAGVEPADPPADADRKLRQLVARHLPAGEVADIARYLSLLLGLGVEAPAAARQPIFFAVRRVLEGVAADVPLLLVIEDLHWAGPSQRELVEYMQRELRQAAVLVLQLSRSDEPGEVIALEPLGPESAAAMLEGLGSGRPIEVARLVEAAAGNPLFLEELAGSAGGVGSGSLPATVREAVAARLDSLPDRQRSLLLDASVIGQHFWRGPLLAIDQGRAVEASLAELAQQGLIRPLERSRVAGDSEFAFKHILIREVAYETLSRADRGSRHLAVARYLEEAAGPAARELAPVLAHHWRQAGVASRAIEHLLVAAGLARDGWAQAECQEYYRQAFELGGEEPVLRTRIGLEQAHSLVQLSDFATAAPLLDALLPGLQGRQRVEALIARARVAYWLEQTADTRRFADLGRELAELSGDTELIAAATVYQVASCYFDGRLAEAAVLAEQAQGRWVPGTRPLDLAELHEFRADVAYWIGNYHEAERHARNAHQLGGEAHSIEPVLRSGGWHGLTIAAQGRSEEAITWLDGILRQAQELDSKWGAGSYNYSSLAFRDMHMFAEARRRNLKALELVSSRGAYGMPEMQAEIDLMFTDLAEGNPGPVEAALPRLWDLAINGRAWRPWLGGGRLALVRAELARQTAGPEEIAVAATDAIRRAHEVGRIKYEAAARAILGPALVRLGQGEQGLAELRTAVALADRLGSPTGRWQFRAGLGELLGARGDDSEAAAAFSEAREIMNGYADALTPEHARHFLAAEPVRNVLRRR